MAKRKRRNATRSLRRYPPRLDRYSDRRRPTLLATLPDPLVITSEWRDTPSTTRTRRPTHFSRIPGRKLYHPERQAAPVLTTRGTPSRGLKPTKTSQLAFIRPKEVAICVRRKQRREIIFASGLGGKRGLGLRKKRHTNEFTKISCK